MRGNGRVTRTATRIAACVVAIALVVTLGRRFYRATRRSGLIAVVVLPLVGGVDAVFAQTFVSPRPIMEPCTRADDFDDVVAWARTTTLQLLQDRLGLTDQQARDLEVMRQARHDAVRRDARTLCEARGELWVLIASTDSDPTAVRAAAEKAKAAQARMLDHRIDGELDLRTLLTLEQWAGWVELLENIVQRRKSLGTALDW